jgi:hypothetical protein
VGGRFVGVVGSLVFPTFIDHEPVGLISFLEKRAARIAGLLERTIAVLPEQRHALARRIRGDSESCHAIDGAAFVAPPFRTSTEGVVYHKVQAEHPEASRSKQPSRCPAPRNQLKPVTQRKRR